MCSCSMLLYFNLLYLVLFFALLHSTLLRIILLRFTLLYALLSLFRFSSNLQFTLLMLSFSLSIRFILLYFALFSFRYIPVCFALLRFFTLPHLLRSVLSYVLLFLFFFSPIFTPILTSPLLRTSHVLLYSLLNLLRWASRHSTSPYSALLRLAWTRGFGEIRAGLTTLCNLLVV